MPLMNACIIFLLATADTEKPPMFSVRFSGEDVVQPYLRRRKSGVGSRSLQFLHLSDDAHVVLWKPHFANHWPTGSVLLSNVSGDSYMSANLWTPASVPLKGEGVCLWYIFIPDVGLWPRHPSCFTRDNFFSSRWLKKQRTLSCVWLSHSPLERETNQEKRVGSWGGCQSSRVLNQFQFPLVRLTGLNNVGVETVCEYVIRAGPGLRGDGSCGCWGLAVTAAILPIRGETEKTWEKKRLV